MHVTILQKVTQNRRAVGLALVALGVALIAVKVWQIIATVGSLQSRLSQAQAMAQSANRNMDVAQIGSLLIGARADVQSLKADAGPLLWLAPHLGWLPGIGGDVQAAPAMLEMADGLAEAGVVVWKAMSPLVSWGMSAEGRGSDVAVEALTQLAVARPQLEQARAALARALASRTSIHAERLSSRLAGQMRKIDGILPLAQVGVDVALAAPEAFGLNGPRTYLILAQNEDELRPTGGFISGVGRVTVDRGKLIELSFTDSSVVDDLTRPYPDLPEPMARYMGMGQMAELWLFRDSNWSPDFPTSAKQAAYFYTYGRQVPVNGVVAVDQHSVQMLLSAIGPVNVVISTTQMTLTGDNVVDTMREAWNPPGGVVTGQWIDTRKSFIGQLAAAIRSRLENNASQVPWLALGRTMVQALQERHILAFATQPDLAASLARMDWDGAIHTTGGDYMMIVDANFGYNKANAAIQQSVNYQVDLTTVTNPQATLRVDYQHSMPSNDACRQEQPYGAGITYQSMMKGCYYDYLRVYVPRESRLIDSSEQQIPADYFLSRQPVNSRAEMLAPEADKSVIAHFLVVEPGKARQISLVYQLPSSVIQWVGDKWCYTLEIQKQPGKLQTPTQIMINLPQGARVVSAGLEQASLENGQVDFELSMAQDARLQVCFR